MAQNGKTKNQLNPLAKGQLLMLTEMIIDKRRIAKLGKDVEKSKLRVGCMNEIRMKLKSNDMDNNRIKVTVNTKKKDLKR